MEDELNTLNTEEAAGLYRTVTLNFESYFHHGSDHIPTAAHQFIKYGDKGGKVSYYEKQNYISTQQPRVRKLTGNFKTAGGMYFLFELSYANFLLLLILDTVFGDKMKNGSCVKYNHLLMAVF